MREDTQKALLESDQAFASFLQRVRKERNIYLEQLAEGLMSASQLARIEKGQRPVHKNMRDRLLGRLGIASDLYENLLDIDDYRTWERQWNILLAVEQRDMNKAQRLIAEYDTHRAAQDKLKQQFCLVMKAELLKQQNADVVKIGECYEQAVKLTVPAVEHLCMEKILLSIQEVNMILEYEYYHKGGDFLEKCNALMVYVSNSVYDELSKVKIYPKIAFYFLREVFGTPAAEVSVWFQKSIQVCDQAIEMLRHTGRAYYLIELLEAKCRLLETAGMDTGEYKECTELINLFQKLYCEYDLPVYMQDCVYLYRQRWVFYIGDVLRIRRKMFGLTQEKLCEGICVPKTLRRTEKMKRNMQQDMLGTVMRRLGLSKEYQRTSLVTNDKDAVQIYEELTICRNDFETTKARGLLRKLVEKVSLEIPENRQYVMEIEASLDWTEGKISKEEFAERVDNALQCTLKIEKMFDAHEVFLTEMEMSCICKRIRVIEEQEKMKYIQVLIRYFELCERKQELSNCISMYEFAMVRIASELGNMGQHQYAINLDRNVIRESLKCRRVWAISKALYNILWDQKEQAIKDEREIVKDKMAEGLQQCITFSHYCHQKYIEKFFSEKLYQL